MTSGEKIIVTFIALTFIIGAIVFLTGIIVHVPGHIDLRP